MLWTIWTYAAIMYVAYVTIANLCHARREDRLERRLIHRERDLSRAAVRIVELERAVLVARKCAARYADERTVLDLAIRAHKKRVAWAFAGPTFTALWALVDDPDA